MRKNNNNNNNNKSNNTPNLLLFLISGTSNNLTSFLSTCIDNLCPCFFRKINVGVLLTLYKHKIPFFARNFA